MQIALTKKLAQAMGVKPVPAGEPENPLFCWTATWTNTFDGRKEDLVVMVNQATRFVVAIYGVKRGQFKDIEAKMSAAIRNTLLSMYLNPKVVDEYMRRAGDIVFTSNHDRKMTAAVAHAGLEAALDVGRAVNMSQEKVKYQDTWGRIASRRPVGYTANLNDGFFPAEEMANALTKLTGTPAWRCRAFELLVTLDLDVYKATRRLIVPADIEFSRLHEVLQKVFDWKNYHLYEFSVYDAQKGKVRARLVPDEEGILHDPDAVLTAGRTLSEYFPKYRHIFYTYDMGDDWQHEIELVRVIDEHDEESPYLLEAVGQTPPEDVGGVGGFAAFREIILDPNHPDHAEAEEWAGYWSPELSEWGRRPTVIHDNSFY